jgi:hypothetical protein
MRQVIETFKIKGVANVERMAPIQTIIAFPEGATKGHDVHVSLYPEASQDRRIQYQLDKKTRWGDGSLRLGLLTIILPKGYYNDSVTVWTDDSVEPYRKVEVKGKVPDCDVEIHVDGMRRAGLLEMLASSALTWDSGDLCTTWYIADHSTERRFDLGADRCARPVFIASWFPTIGSCRVRCILENCNTEALSNCFQDFEVKFKGGEGKSFYLDRLAANTRVSWVGYFDSRSGEWDFEDLPHHGLEVTRDVLDIAEARAILPFSRNSAKEQSSRAKWDLVGAGLSQEADAYEAGWMRPAGASGGDHPQIGPYPDPDVTWLLTGSVEAGKAALWGADRCTRYPTFFREGRAGQRFAGRWVSCEDRPSVMLSNLGYAYTDEGDRITPMVSNLEPPKTSHGTAWSIDTAHLPNWGAIPYLMTGDLYFLENMQGIASWVAARSNGAATRYFYGRGPTGREGALTRQVRGQGWGFHQRLDAWQMSDDGDPFKEYLERTIGACIDVWRGERSSMLPGLNDLPESISFDWGNSFKPNYQRAPSESATACQLTSGNLAYAHYKNHIDMAKCSAAEALWQVSFLTMAWGRAVDLGFPAEDLMACAIQFWSVELLHPANADAPRVDAYARPVLSRSGEWLTTSKVRDAYVTPDTDLPEGILPQIKSVALLPLDSHARNPNHAYRSFLRPGIAAAASHAHLLRGIDASRLSSEFREIGDTPGQDSIWGAFVVHARDFSHDLNWDVSPLDGN